MAGTVLLLRLISPSSPQTSPTLIALSRSPVVDHSCAQEMEYVLVADHDMWDWRFSWVKRRTPSVAALSTVYHHWSDWTVGTASRDFVRPSCGSKTRRSAFLPRLYAASSMGSLAAVSERGTLVVDYAALACLQGVGVASQVCDVTL